MQRLPAAPLQRGSGEGGRGSSGAPTADGRRVCRPRCPISVAAARSHVRTLLTSLKAVEVHGADATPPSRLMPRRLARLRVLVSLAHHAHQRPVRAALWAPRPAILEERGRERLSKGTRQGAPSRPPRTPSLHADAPRHARAGCANMFLTRLERPAKLTCFLLAGS